MLRATRSGFIRDAAVEVVISSRAGVRALDVAREYGVAAEAVEAAGLDRSAYDERLADALIGHGVEPGSGLVLLAGYMRLLTPGFVTRFSGRILNIHPSLLPSFPGLEAQRQALEHGVKVTGCTVHFVVPEVDAGPIVLQRAVEVIDGDTVESLSARILEQEHSIYPLAVKLFVEGKLSIKGREVSIAP